MHLESIIKLIKSNCNCLGYIKASKLISLIIQYINNNTYCMKCSIVREPNCKHKPQTIFKNILLPVIQAKNCNYKINHSTINIYSRSMFNLRIIDKACALLTHQLSDTYNFQFITNYDIISQEQEKLV